MKFNEIFNICDHYLNGTVSAVTNKYEDLICLLINVKIVFIFN